MTAPGQPEKDEKKEAARQAYDICQDVIGKVTRQSGIALLTNIFGIACGYYAASAFQMPVLNGLAIDAVFIYSAVKRNKTSQNLKKDFSAAVDSAVPEAQRLLAASRKKIEDIKPLSAKNTAFGYLFKTRPFWTVLTLLIAIPDNIELLPGLIAAMASMDQTDAERAALHAVYDTETTLKEKYPDIAKDPYSKPM